MQKTISFAVLLIVSFSLLTETKRECGFECIEYDWGYDNETIYELVVRNLKRDGPVDGVCLTKDKWLVNGTPFGIQSKCVCVDIPTDAYIKPGDGPRCPAMCIAALDETSVEYFTRCHDAVKSFAPANGWCPKGQIKWVVTGERIGRPLENNTCHCFDNYEFVSEDVKCVEVPTPYWSFEGEL